MWSQPAYYAHNPEINVSGVFTYQASQETTQTLDAIPNLGHYIHVWVTLIDKEVSCNVSHTPVNVIYDICRYHNNLSIQVPLPYVICIVTLYAMFP